MNSYSKHDLKWHLDSLVFELGILIDEVEDIVKNLAGQLDLKLVCLHCQRVHKIRTLHLIMSGIVAEKGEIDNAESRLNHAKYTIYDLPRKVLRVGDTVEVLSSEAIYAFVNQSASIGDATFKY